MSKDTSNGTTNNNSDNNNNDTSKNIVICCDGTGNEYREYNSNVVKTFEAIVRNERHIAFYDPGVGTISPLGRRVGRRTGILLSNAFGYGLTQNIEDGYEYLMNRFKPGDKIFLFGFSRGAFTVRLLADMICRLGLLQKGSKNLIPYVSKYYNDEERAFSTKPKWVKIRNRFKDTFCQQECSPHFIGVWDTVDSLGYINGRKFHDHNLNSAIKHAFQAISIDEKRNKFKVNLWNENPDEENAKKQDKTQDEEQKATKQVIEQVLFAGDHSDLGGSHGPKGCGHHREIGEKDKYQGLGDIAFAWMMNRAEAHGLVLKPNWEDSLHQNCLGDLHDCSKSIPWLFLSSEPRRFGPGKEGRENTKKKEPELKLPIKIHQSVIDRINSDELKEKKEKYRPKNLIKGYNLKELEEKYEVVTNDSYQNRTKA